jgi:hypothetical protein
MTIDTSGKWWIGDAPSDIEEYLKELKVEGYAVDRFTQSRCKCGSFVFALNVDRENEAAMRTCAVCSLTGPIGDSEKYFDANTAEPYVCVECGSRQCNVGVGFSLYEPTGIDIRWVSVGVRCAKCGVLGCFGDWKVGGGNDVNYFDMA